jgi:hypothetical protein
MIDFFVSQLKNFNVIMFILIVLFNSILSRNIISKILKEESKETYNQFEEVKQEIWRAKK